jgi:serine/threonine protein kinase
VDSKTRENIKFVKYSFTKDFPEGAKDFIDKLLVKDPKGRMNPE